MHHESTSIRSILLKILYEIFILFLISVPFFYLDAVLILAGREIPFFYFSLCIVRYGIAVILGCRFRKKYRLILSESKTVCCHILFGILLCVFIFLREPYILLNIYYSIGDLFGILYPKDGPLLPSVIWEQFGRGRFILSIFLCIIVTFFNFRFVAIKPPKREKP